MEISLNDCDCFLSATSCFVNDIIKRFLDIN